MSFGSWIGPGYPGGDNSDWGDENVCEEQVTSLASLTEKQKSVLEKSGKKFLVGCLIFILLVMGFITINIPSMKRYLNRYEKELVLEEGEKYKGKSPFWGQDYVEIARDEAKTIRHSEHLVSDRMIVIKIRIYFTPIKIIDKQTIVYLSERCCILTYTEYAGNERIKWSK